MTPRVIHAVLIGGPPLQKDHRTSSTCPCGPVQSHRDLSTAAPIFIHHPFALVPPPRPVGRELLEQLRLEEADDRPKEAS